MSKKKHSPAKRSNRPHPSYKNKCNSWRNSYFQLFWKAF